MKNAEKYRQFAADCRRIAPTMPPQDRASLLAVADAWDRAADAETSATEKSPTPMA